MSCGRVCVLCVQTGHLCVALHQGRADLWLVGMVLIQVATQGAEVASTVLTGLAHGVYGHSSFGHLYVDIAFGVGAQRSRSFEHWLS